LAEDSLPFPIDAECASAFDLLPIESDLNRQMIRRNFTSAHNSNGIPIVALLTTILRYVKIQTC
jgi:hypothetical protein